MSDQRLCTIAHYDVDDTDDMVMAIDEMVNQLNNSSLIDVEFSHYHETDTIYPPGSEFSNETEYIEACLDEIYDTAAVQDGDSWLVIDTMETFGYGRGNVSRTFSNGSFYTRLYGARALHVVSQLSTPDSEDMLRNLCIHEMTHNFTVAHKNGCYSETSGGNGYNVTPMATAYTHTSGSYNAVDSCYAGSAEAPDTFRCDGNHKDNFELGGWCSGDCGGKCRHDWTLTEETIDKIEDDAPLGIYS